MFVEENFTARRRYAFGLPITVLKLICDGIHSSDTKPTKFCPHYRHHEIHLILKHGDFEQIFRVLPFPELQTVSQPFLVG
jgi:hypothetical protein